MKRIATVALVGLLLIGIAITAMAGKPLITAHGEFKTEFHIAGQWLDIQISFNVQDRGEVDHGNLSLRIFDHWTGKLVAVGLTYGEMDVYPIGDWVFFASRVRMAYFDDDYYLPLHIDVFWFQAYDGGRNDQFKLLNAPLPLLEGKIIVN